MPEKAPVGVETTTTYWACFECGEHGIYEQAGSGGAADKHTKTTGHGTSTSLRPFPKTPLVGDQVRKVKGYEFDSVVVAVFTTQAGATRLVCESVLLPGMLHIFAPNQMRLA